MKTYIDNKVNLTGIAPLELAEIFEAPPSELLLKHEDCNLVWLPCDGILYAQDRDEDEHDSTTISNIFRNGNFAEVIRDYYEDTSELVTMFRNLFEINPALKNMVVDDDYDNHSIELVELIDELDGITITELDSEELRLGLIFSKHDLWMNQAPSWNFELSKDELLAKALEVGFVKKVGDDRYLVNNDFTPKGDFIPQGQTDNEK